jgi:hypothetical protein
MEYTGLALLGGIVGGLLLGGLGAIGGLVLGFMGRLPEVTSGPSFRFLRRKPTDVAPVLAQSYLLLRSYKPGVRGHSRVVFNTLKASPALT